MIENYPLVSVCVLTYNSSKTVLDTLESVYNQSYPNLELIISDDGSNDDTLNIIHHWIHHHLLRFKNVNLITVKKNTGIPANCNRAWAAANGIWIKLIAGDDCLLQSCIADYVYYINHNINCEIIFSNHLEFKTYNGEKKIIREMPKEKFIEKFNSRAENQLSIYLTLGPNFTPTLFIKKDLLYRLGGFPTKYRFFEDTPFITNVLKKGIKIWYMSKATVLYRVGSLSVSNTGSTNKFYNIKFMESFLQFRKEEVSPLFPWYRIDFWSREFSRKYDYYLCTKILNNKRTTKNQCIRMLFSIINPYKVLGIIKSFVGVKKTPPHAH